MGSSRIHIGPTHADGQAVPFDPRPLTVDQAEPGDLVFVAAEATPLGAVIAELDGCAFSHVGVLVVEDGTPQLLSARTDRTPTPRSPDLGGIRPDRLDALGDRRLFVAPLRLGAATRAAGLARLARWSEGRPGDDGISRSRFSYAKLVVVAAALAAVRRRRPLGIDAATELWERAVAAAEALRWTDDVPAFYCAEAVAAAYELEYPTDALWVRDGEPHPAGCAAPPAVVDRDEMLVAEVLVDGVVDLSDRPAPSAEVALDELDDIVRDVLRALIDIGLTRDQAWAAPRLLMTLWRHDRPLAQRLVVAAWEVAGRPPDEPHHPVPLPTGPFVPPPFVAGVAAPLPTALVTPRMLLSEAVVRSVHPLVPVGPPAPR